MAQKQNNTILTIVAAAALAWLVPGLAHIYLGRRLRGLILVVLTAATFWTGIAIGGVMTVDNRTERWWFAADMITGIHGLLSWQRSERVNRQIDEKLQKEPEFKEFRDATAGMVARLAEARASRNKRDIDARQAEYDVVRNTYAGGILQSWGLAPVSPVDTVARAYCGVAGLLNLMCIFDAIMLAQMGRRGEQPPEPKPEDRQEAKA